MWPDTYAICRKSKNSYRPWEVLHTFDTLEDAEKEVRDFDRYAWRDNEEVVIFRMSHTAVSSTKATVTLDKRQL